jgi:hypothetical protein
MRTDNEKIRQTWRGRIRLRAVVDSHRLMESNFRAAYRIAPIRGHLSLTNNEQCGDGPMTDGRAG